jgi:hypothetical protein
MLSKIAQPNHEIAAVLAAVIFLASLSYFSFSYIKPLYDPWGMQSFKAGTELNRIAPPYSLAAVADGGDPTCLYYSRRKGWHFLDDFGSTPANSQQAITVLEKLRKQGAKYLVFPRYTFWWLDYFKDFRSHVDSRYRPVRRTNEYVIFDLTGSRVENGSSASPHAALQP